MNAIKENMKRRSHWCNILNKVCVSLNSEFVALNKFKTAKTLRKYKQFLGIIIIFRHRNMVEWPTFSLQYILHVKLYLLSTDKKF